MEHGYTFEYLERMRAETMKREVLKLLQEDGIDPDRYFKEMAEEKLFEERNEADMARRKGDQSKDAKDGKKSKTQKRPKKRSDKDGKRGKPGQLFGAWPHKLGAMFLLKFWSVIIDDPDEVYLSRAFEYFDVQAFCLLKTVCEVMGMPLPARGSQLTYIEVKTIIACLNVVIWLSKNVIAPAHEIKAEDIEKLQSLGGVTPPKVSGSKGKKKQTKGKTSKKSGQVKKKTRQTGEKSTEKESARQWDELALPQICPDQGDGSIGEGQFQDPKEKFKNTFKYYDPKNPEFMYGGFRSTPQIEFGSGDRWQITDIPETCCHHLAPQPVPRYYPNLRPLILLPKETVEKLPSPWYVMSDRNFYNLKATQWDNIQTVEQLELLGQLIWKAITVPKLSVPAFIEMIAELCSAISYSEDEECSDEERILDEKRQIIIERILLKFLSTKFRDYNDETEDYMKVFSKRAAVLVRYLLKKTAKVLWEYQSAPYDEEEEPEPEEEKSDPRQIEAWSDWLKWLLEASEEALEWSKWLLKLGEEVTKMHPSSSDLVSWIKSNKEIGYLWMEKGEKYTEMAKEYAVKAQKLERVFNRLIEHNPAEDVSE